MPTMVDSYRTHVPLDGEVCLVEVMDTAGDELFLSLTEDQLRRGGGVASCVSLDQNSINMLLQQGRIHAAKFVKGASFTKVL